MIIEHLYHCYNCDRDLRGQELKAHQKERHEITHRERRTTVEETPEEPLQAYVDRTFYGRCLL